MAQQFLLVSGHVWIARPETRRPDLHRLQQPVILTLFELLNDTVRFPAIRTSIIPCPPYQVINSVRVGLIASSSLVDPMSKDAINKELTHIVSRNLRFRWGSSHAIVLVRL